MGPSNPPTSVALPTTTQPVAAAPSLNSWVPPQSEKAAIRDPRLNRAAASNLHGKESMTAQSKREAHGAGGLPSGAEKRAAPLPPPLEKPLNRLERMRIPRKEPQREEREERMRPSKKDMAAAEERIKSKSVSPAGKDGSGRIKNEPESLKSSESVRRDPRLRRHAVEKVQPEDDVPKERKRGLDKKERDDSGKTSERTANTRSKLSNGSLNKQEKQEFRIGKLSGKRSRSRSRSRSPPIPKRKERRSPKSVKGSSTSPPPKFAKGRQGIGKHSHPEDVSHHGTSREDRVAPKNAEPRRPKRSHEERTSEPRDAYSTREPPESKENIKRWRSGWEEKQ